MNLLNWFRKPPAQKITTYQRSPEGVQKVALGSIPPTSSQPSPSLPVDAEKLDLTLDQLRQERRRELKTGQERPVAPPVSKDASNNPECMHMAWDPADRSSFHFITQMAEIGKVEGFRVVADCPQGQQRRFQRRLPQEVADHITTVSNPGSHDTWTEDHGEFTQGGELVVPAILAEDAPIEDWIMEHRGRRYSEAEKEGLPRPGADYGSLGTVNDRQSQQELIASALASGLPKIKMAVSYVEGGNFLTGKKPDGTPFALVGKDSVAVTREVMREAGRRLTSDRDAVDQIARDYGLKPGQVTAVEQPGEFHLDMSMALAGPGQVVLNDARKVADIQKDWVEEHYQNKWFTWGKRAQLEAIEARAKKLAVYEDMVERDLRKAGLQVFRVPGCFAESVANREMNFMNLRQGVNEQGQPFAVSLGGDERAEKMFAHTLLEDIPSGYHRVHFLDRDLTADTLALNGGIKCRTKTRTT